MGYLIHPEALKGGAWHPVVDDLRVRAALRFAPRHGVQARMGRRGNLHHISV